MANMSMPSGFGGLLRYDEEYTSRLMLKPVHVLVFIALIVVFRITLGLIL